MFKHHVGDLAKRPPLVTADATMTQAADVMARESASCLAAVNGSKVVGFLTESVLVRHLDVDMDPDTPILDILSPATGAISRDMPVSEAVKLMLERRVRHLPVLDKGGSLLGLVTDKELVDALAVDFMVENIQCRELMRADAAVLAPDRPVREALGLMRQQSTDCVLAVAGGKPVGIFSERDATAKIMGHPERLTEPVSRFMSGPVATVPTDAMVYKVILFMRQKSMRRVAVVQQDGALAGILTQQSILAYARRMQ
ncbi:MAG: CBS domain-containing protein [Solidesulfovibrio sp.]